MRQAEKKYFGDIQQGRLNADDSPFVVGTNEWVNSENIRTGSTDKGFTGIVESVGGNAELPEPPSAKIYYFNLDDSTTAGYYELGTTPSISPFSTITLANLASAKFITNIGEPNDIEIKNGCWNFSCVMYNNGSTTQPKIQANIFIYSLGGATSLIAQSDIIDVPAITARVSFNVLIPQQILLPTDRISIEFVASNVTGGLVVFIPQSSSLGNYYNFLTTNIGSVKSIYDYTTIGSVEDTENKRIVYFNYDNSANRLDRIVCYYLDGNKQYNVLLSSQVQGGLNFDKYSLIHSAKISNGNILSWVDGTNNEPRKINIESGIKANDSSFQTDAKEYTLPLNFSEVTLIKIPPAYTPNIFKKNDPLFLNNLIQYDSFEFAFQYEYYDNEISVVGSYSEGSKLNYPTYTSSPPNYIEVDMDLREIVPNTVKLINLIVRISDGTNNGGVNAFIVKTWNKNNDDDNQAIINHNIGNSALSYNFYNNITGQYLAQDDVLRAFDNVPIFSQTHEVSKSRYFLANNIEGYNAPATTSLQAAMSNIANIALLAPPYAVFSFKFKAGSEVRDWHQTFNPIVGYQYRWSYWGYYIWTTANTPNGIQTGYFELSRNYNLDNNYGTVFPTLRPYPSDPTFPSTITVGSLKYMGTNQAEIERNASIYVHQLNPSHYNSPIVQERIWASAGQTNVSGLSSNYYNVFPQLSTYKFGVVFYDYAMRKCSVVPRTTTGNQLFYTFDFNVEGSTPDEIIVHDDISTYLVIGDTIVISGSTGIDGTYTVSAFGYNSILNVTNIIVNQFVPTSASTLGTIDIYRYSTQDLTTPQRDFDYSQAIGGIEWRLDNTNSLTEIPDWAYYYTVVRTMNLRTRFFFQSFVDKQKAKYGVKDSNGATQFNSTIYNSFQVVSIGLHTEALIQSGLGYTYSEGDICILTRSDNTVFEIPVIGQDGNYIVLKSQDIGNLGTTNNYSFIYEIYTPYKTSEQEPYYEVGEIYQIINPTTATRQYSVLQDIFAADSYIFNRSFSTTVYNANGMSPNDLYWKRWDSDAGKANIISRLGKTDKNTNITWSDTYISGTQINGSSTFRLGNETFVSDDCGSITKLQLTSKVQDQGQGSVMLALCNSEINSIYIGETQITDSTGKTQFFSASQGVISTINILKGNYGCISPESVVQYRGKVYFVDLANGRVVQYSDNGLDAISNIKMMRFWKNWSYKYQSMTKQDIEAFGDRPYIFSMVDSGHDELLISLPKLSDNPPKGYLPDYPNAIYPFDILDYQGKTMVYCMGSAAQVYPHWQGAYTFTTENFVAIQNRLFSFKNGGIYEHNQELQNTFYGVSSPSKIMFTSNILSQVPKVYDNFVVESNLMPSFVYFYNDFPYIQTSDLADTDFKQLEGIWYANILRNKIVPTATGFTTDGLLTSEVMRNTNMYVEADFYPDTNPLQLRLLQLGMSISKGHTIT